MRLFVLLLLLAIVASLGSAAYALLRRGGDPRGVARALTIRISLSLLLFGLLMLGWSIGLLTPHGVTP